LNYKPIDGQAINSKSHREISKGVASHVLAHPLVAIFPENIFPFNAKPGKFRKIQTAVVVGLYIFFSFCCFFSDHPLNANEKQAATKITIRKKSNFSYKFVV